jgi:hypothetical protein
MPVVQGRTRFSAGTCLPLDRMRVVEANQPFTVWSMQRQRIFDVPSSPLHHDDTASAAPTGDAQQRTTETEDRSAPRCPHCGGPLLPFVRRNLHLDELPPPDT